MSSKWLESAADISQLLISYYCNQDGLVVRTSNADSGKKTSDLPLIDELGDYCQYIYLTGKILSNPKIADWAEEQAITACENGFDEKTQLIYPYGIKQKKFVGIYPLIRMGDFFWGMNTIYKYTKNTTILNYYKNYIAAVQNHCTHGVMPSYGCLNSNLCSFTIPLCEPMTAGYMTESLMEMYISTQDSSFLDLATSITNSWLAKESFVKNSVFYRSGWLAESLIPKSILNWQFSFRQRPSLKSNILTKGDTFLLFAVLRLYRLTGNKAYKHALDGWVEMLEKEMVTADGRFYNSWDISSGKKFSVKLEENHSIIELLIDIAHFLKNEKALNLAYNAIKGWINKSTDKLYRNCDGDHWFELDPIIDLNINIFKYCELSANEELYEFASQSMGRVRKRFQAPYGMYQKISVDSNVSYSSVENKFLGLYIKACLLMDNIETGHKIMSNDELHLLATDR